MSNVWETERKEIATWLSGYLSMIKKWVDKILDNEDHDVDKNKIIRQKLHRKIAFKVILAPRMVT